MTRFSHSWPLEVQARGPHVEFDQQGFRLPSTALPEYVTNGVRVTLSVEIVDQVSYHVWGRGYAQQGGADLAVYRHLEALRRGGKISDCHEVHYLQMALEKIARAFMLRRSKGDRGRYLDGHVVVGEFLKPYGADPLWARRFREHTDLWQEVKLLAVAIERLAPAVERDTRPANAEYPWSDGRRVTWPANVVLRGTVGVTPGAWAALADALEELATALSG